MGSIESRRSIRSFDRRKIEQSIVEAILEAGLQAPSPKNRQPWRFVVIMEDNIKKQMVTSMCDEIRKLKERKKDREDIDASLETMRIIEEAPVVILVCYEYGMIDHHDDGVDWEISATDLEAVELQSVGAAVENMLLKAEELGVGSLWCGDILYAYKTISKYSEKPVVSAVCLGYKRELPDVRNKKSISEMCEFY